MSPTHPPFVHFPITTSLLTAGLDAVYFLSTYAPTATLVASTWKTLGIAIPPSMFPVLSYYTTILTLLFAIPAVATGAMELMPVIQRDGFSSKKAKAGVAHAVINDIAIFGTAYNWWTRRAVTGFTPANENVLLSSAIALPATLFGAYLGGQLVYQYGMGFSRGEASKKKQ